MLAARQSLRAAAALLLMLASAGFAFAQGATLAIGAPSVIVVPPKQLNDAIGPCRDARVAALGGDKLAVGWTVEDGPAQGVYVRWRINYTLEPAMRIAAGSTTAARDLAMAFDSAGRLYLAWTAEGAESRELHFARLDAPGQAGAPVSIVRNLSDSQPTTATEALSAISDIGDVDFPTLAPDQNGGMLVAWQQSRGVRYSIRALRVGTQGELSDLGTVSGSSPSGLNPQILSAEPARIAWYEVDELTSAVRVNEWHADDKRWRPSALEAQARIFDPVGQVQFQAAAGGDHLIGCWRQDDENGRPILAVGRPRDIGEKAAVHPADIQVFGTLDGDPSAPVLAGGAQPMLAWQNFNEAGQRIQIAPVNAASGPGSAGATARRAPLSLSAASERFASMPALAAQGNWSGVAWIDDARDGGTGDLYFSEVVWPAAAVIAK